jgi:hypothetical protein
MRSLRFHQPCLTVWHEERVKDIRDDGLAVYSDAARCTRPPTRRQSLL